MPAKADRKDTANNEQPNFFMDANLLVRNLKMGPNRIGSQTPWERNWT
jgi:hypothetical protein